MTPEDIDRRIQTVRRMIASYSLLLRHHEEESSYARRKISEYDRELDTLMDKRKALA